jgi:hypothetical protein
MEYTNANKYAMQLKICLEKTIFEKNMAVYLRTKNRITFI